MSLAKRPDEIYYKNYGHNCDTSNYNKDNMDPLKQQKVLVKEEYLEELNRVVKSYKNRKVERD